MLASLVVSGSSCPNVSPKVSLLSLMNFSSSVCTPRYFATAGGTRELQYRRLQGEELKLFQLQCTKHCQCTCVAESPDTLLYSALNSNNKCFLTCGNCFKGISPGSKPEESYEFITLFSANQVKNCQTLDHFFVTVLSFGSIFF